MAQTHADPLDDDGLATLVFFQKGSHTNMQGLGNLC